MAEKLKLNRSTVRALLKDPDLERHLRGIADGIAARAGDGFRASSMIGKNRARASVMAVTPAAMRAEAKSGALSKAAGGG